MLDTATKDTINKFLRPSQPVDRGEMLRGRELQLADINASLSSPGRGIFVYGVRGVGKTSLAQTAAYQFAHAGNCPLLLSCDPSTTMARFVRELAAAAVGEHPLELRSTVAKEKGAKLWVLDGSKRTEIEMGSIPTPSGVNEAIAILRYATQVVGDQPIVVVVDEFERMTNIDEIALFGDLVKQVGDQSINIKFLFCGVGRSLDDLLAGHGSCFRYLEGVPLERLGITPSIEIIDAAASALGVQIDDGYRYRIAQVSDGFPHYVHLIGHKMFWTYCSDQDASKKIESRHFEEAIKQAAASVEPHLKQDYALATEKFANSGDDYEIVLWAAASHPDLRRKASDIYEDVCKICKRLGRSEMDRSIFNNRLNPLKALSHGAVLEGSRQGWYEFREPMLRGLCRLRAMAKYGLDLGKEYYK